MSQSDQLFKLFGRVRLSKEKIMQNGIGLGLTVTSLLLETMGGKIKLDWTQEGKGT